MRIQSLFDLVEDAKGIVQFFEGVDTGEQMVSALERLKKRDSGELLSQIQSLRFSVSQLLGDTFEMSGFGPDDDDETDDGLGDLFDDEEGKVAEDSEEEQGSDGSQGQENQKETTS